MPVSAPGVFIGIEFGRFTNQGIASLTYEANQ